MRSRSAGEYPSRSASARPISKWNSPCGSSATLRYIAFTLASSSFGSKATLVAVMVLFSLDCALRAPTVDPVSPLGTSKAERCRAGLDQLVHLARTGDLHAVDQVALLVSARFDAGRAGPQSAAAGEEILHQRRQRLERRNHGAVDRA